MLPQGPQGQENVGKGRNERSDREDVPARIAEPVRQCAAASREEILPKTVARLLDISGPVKEERDETREDGDGDPVIRRLHLPNSIFRKCTTASS